MSQFAAVLHDRLPGAPSGALWRGLALAIVAALALSSQDSMRLTLEALSEAYLAVSVFVAGTLALVYGLERWLKTDIGVVLARHGRWQVPAAALLGAFPGCGGAIVVITQYTKGHLGFGAVVAALTATMGDAMFLLLATEPLTGAGVYATGLIVGALSGLAVDRLHGADFLRVRAPARAAALAAAQAGAAKPLSVIERAWLALIVPGLAIGVLSAFQIEVDALFGAFAGLEPTLWLGVGGAALALLMWAPGGSDGAVCAADGDPACAPAPPASTVGRVIGDTNFITAWVVFAFLAYELGVHLTGIDLAAVFAVAAPAVPLLAILVGFIPGCGPQIVVTSLYLSGALPLSALLGNAISNDGDALFPALALAPRAAVIATLYSAVPALVVAYGTHLLWDSRALVNSAGIMSGTWS